MKLKFETKDDISILLIQGDIDRHHFAVLKAGITKFLRDRKKNVVLNFAAAEKIDDEVIHELGSLATIDEGCTVALSGVAPELKQQILKISALTGIGIFGSDEEAIRVFRESAKVGVPEELKKKLAEQDAEIAALKEQLKILSGKSGKSAQDAELTTKNRTLEEQLRFFVLERRIPPDREAIEKKIALLDETIQDLSKKSRTKESRA